MYQSVAGSALSVLVHSLLLMPLETIKPLLPSLLALLPSVDRLNKALPAAAVLEEQELEWPVQGELCDTISCTCCCDTFINVNFDINVKYLFGFVTSSRFSIDF